MTRYGFKELTAGNWAQPDEVSAIFVSADRLRDAPVQAGSEWAARFLEPQLGGHVPEEVRKLFEVAKGIAVYGFFFYPLYAVSAGEVYRVLDAAAIWRCRQLDAPRLWTLKNRVDWLAAQGHPDEKGKSRWDLLTSLRNYTSHPSRNMILPPADALDHLQMAVEEINSLFPGRYPPASATEA